jgi:arginine/lysine/ornithine decarboxylase
VNSADEDEFSDTLLGAGITNALNCQKCRLFYNITSDRRSSTKLEPYTTPELAAENIDDAKAEEVRQRAAARLREKLSSEEVASVSAAIARSLAQLKLSSTEIDKRLNEGPELASANFVIPYPLSFPIKFPGQFINAETIEFMRKLDVKEIHGYTDALGLKSLNPAFLQSVRTP